MTLTNTSHIAAQLTGIGWISAAGSSCGIAGDSPYWPIGTPAVPDTILKSLKGGSRFGRLDLFSQIGVAAVGLALQDAGRLPATGTATTQNGAQTKTMTNSIGLICATTSSCSLTDHDFFNTVKDKPHLASPGLFVYTLATSFLGEAALRFSLTGLTMAVIETQPNAADAICLAIEELNSGDDEKIVVGICNLFKEDNQTPPASGALFLVLENDSETALTPKNRSYATLSCDPKKNDLYCNNQPCPDIFSLQKIICG